MDARPELYVSLSELSLSVRQTPAVTYFEINRESLQLADQVLKNKRVGYDLLPY
ncbi:MAG TPA: hypothetical protein VGD40_08650 [Chryseosolibacter sp.]